MVSASEGDTIDRIVSAAYPCEMRIWLLLCVVLPALSGCGGYYILTVPDQLAKADGELVPVCRLQRNDFFVLALAAKNQPMRFRLYPTPDTAPGGPGEGYLRCASTDKTGYAGVHFPMADKPVEGKGGLYYMKVALQDFEGEELSAAVPVYVWDPAKPVVAVEFDCLPSGFYDPEAPAAQALRRLGESANILYLTRNNARTQDDAHRRITEMQIPDGPVLLWQRKRWHIVRDGRFKLPRVIVESRLMSQLPKLVETFPKMTFGICRSELAAKAFVNADLKCIVVDNAWMTGSQIIHRASWDELAQTGLPE